MQSTNLPPSFVGQLYHVPTVHVCHNIIPVGIQLVLEGSPLEGSLLFFCTRTVRSYNTCWRVRKLPSNDLPRPCLHTIKCMQVRGVDRWNLYPVGTSMCQPAHVPVGTISCTPGRDENLLKPGRDFWGRPTGTITIRQLYSRPGLSSSEQRNPTGFISSRCRPYFPLFPCWSLALPVRHQLDRCAGHTLLDTEIPELALFRILPCVHIKSRSGFLRYRSVLFSLVFLPRPGL